MDHDTGYLQLCTRLIEEKLNWRPAEEWRNYEFTELSEKILDATSVNLSATTLKRIFGKLKYDSLPSSATLNALAAFLGYESWMDFKSKQPLNKQEPGKTTIFRKKFLLQHKVWPVTAAAVVIVGILAFTFLSGKSVKPLKNENEIVFTSKPLADGLPNSVVFNVDLKGNTPNKIVIQQSWDSTKTVVLQTGQKEATGIYYLPGYFRAKLILDGKIIKEHDLFIRSDNWMATVDHQPIPSYIKKDDLLLKDEMTVSKNVLKEIKTITKPTWLTYHLVKPFDGLQSDNFTLESSIRNTFSEGPAVCKTARIFVLCSKGAFIIPFTIPGCIGDINLKANDHYLDGHSNDLSSFSTDLSDWANVKVEVRNRVMKIFLNDKLVRQETYKADAGEVVGIRFSFLGAGAVKKIKLLDGKEAKVYAGLTGDN
ncbi:MAG TPA: hypothetical protein VHQ93_07805 [Chitinophagaceae bacterium]|jgi:hypothetical protein|nr:hypothetical protein [Chitinophagaceae bacterium]